MVNPMVSDTKHQHEGAVRMGMALLWVGWVGRPCRRGRLSWGTGEAQPGLEGGPGLPLWRTRREERGARTHAMFSISCECAYSLKDRGFFISASWTGSPVSRGDRTGF